MGRLARRVDEFPDLGDELKGRIKEALERRNFLVHDYWREAGSKFATEEGRAEMIAELSKDTETLEKLASDIMEATKPVRKKFGISEEILNEKVEVRMAQLRDGMCLD
jgi:predicted secreted protein